MLSALIIGLVGMVIFVFYESKVAMNPLVRCLLLSSWCLLIVIVLQVPFALLSNRTSLSGYIQTFICPIIAVASICEYPLPAATVLLNICLSDFIPTYLQACKGTSPIKSGIDCLPYAFTMGVVLVVTGGSIAATKAYRPQLWLGWIFFMVAMGAMSTVRADTPVAHMIGFPVLLGVGGGIVYSATYFPVLAPLPVSENAHALALFAFFRSFAGVRRMPLAMSR